MKIKMILKKLWVLALIVISLIFSSCSMFEKKIVYVVLFDISGSTSSKFVKDAYSEDFQKLIMALRGKERIISFPISENGLANVNYVVNDEIPGYNPLKFNEDDYQNLKDSCIKIITDKAGEIIYANDNKSTDIFNAIMTASKVMKNDEFENYEKRLVIFSDMFENSEEYNFETCKTTSDQIEKILEAESEKMSLPDLKNIKVTVCGAGLQGEHPAKNTDRLKWLEKFWIQYFKTCGVKFTAENYNTRLISFNSN